jgi:hypothetical protein
MGVLTGIRMTKRRQSQALQIIAISGCDRPVAGCRFLGLHLLRFRPSVLMPAPIT